MNGSALISSSRKQGGFILSLGLIVVLTMVVIGLFVGISSVRDAWFKKKVFENSIDVYVMDENNKVLGKAVDFDEHESPLVPFVDYDVPAANGGNYRVLVGVRDDRFTTREKLYYPNSQNCTGQPCIFVPSTEVSGPATINSVGVDDLIGTGGVSYQIATQAGGGVGTKYNYAVGATQGGLPGQLFRQTATDCTIVIDPVLPTFISYWQSQRVVATGGTDSGGGTNPPCYTELFAEPGLEVASVRCQDPWTEPNKLNDNCCQPGDVPGKECPPLDANRCERGAFLKTSGGFDRYVCDCPPGWSDLSGNNSGRCCPPGSTSSTPGACQQEAQVFAPNEGDFLFAEPVVLPGGDNVLDNLGPTFRVNLPIHPDNFMQTAPDGEGP